MPAPVPPGFTRGPIFFFGPMVTPVMEAQLLQRFWDHAGAFGARVVVISTEAATDELARGYVTHLAEWESDWAQVLPIHDREAARHNQFIEDIQKSTGILILGRNPVKLATLMGGTPLAQAVRRANARGKAVGGMAGGGAVLCEHMIAFDTHHGQGHHPYLHRHLIQFAPGLGLTNRVVVDSFDPRHSQEQGTWMQLARLLNAVAYNPFLVGVGVKPDAALALYPDNSLEVFGGDNVLLVDGSQISDTNIHEAPQNSPVSVLGVQLHVLAAGYTFNLSELTAHPPQSSDIPQGEERESAF